MIRNITSPEGARYSSWKKVFLPERCQAFSPDALCPTGPTSPTSPTGLTFCHHRSTLPATTAQQDIAVPGGTVLNYCGVPGAPDACALHVGFELYGLASQARSGSETKESANRKFGFAPRSITVAGRGRPSSFHSLSFAPRRRRSWPQAASMPPPRDWRRVTLRPPWLSRRAKASQVARVGVRPS